MGSTNTHGVILRGIGQKDLPLLEKWYKMTGVYGYATGFKEFSKIKPELLDTQIKNKIVLMIDIKETGETIGFIYGEIKKTGERQVLWIYILLIDYKYQHKGYGTRAVNLLLDNIRAQYGSIALMVSVSKNNPIGLRFWKKLGLKSAYLDNQKPSHVEILVKEI
ncbi:MAG: GNAT family N-acetyltransferase [Clostridiaceae bacterium]|nr:GNAT family N-acetyltransferase [Clostridiaceae bacterium]